MINLEICLSKVLKFLKKANANNQKVNKNHRQQNVTSKANERR